MTDRKLTDEEAAAVRDYERLADIAAKITGKAATGAEKQKGIAYQRLVRMGLRMQIKKKYRG